MTLSPPSARGPPPPQLPSHFLREFLQLTRCISLLYFFFRAMYFLAVFIYMTRYIWLVLLFFSMCFLFVFPSLMSVCFARGFAMYFFTFFFLLLIPRHNLLLLSCCIFPLSVYSANAIYFANVSVRYISSQCVLN